MYWFVRQQNRVTGPFPAGQIQQSVLLGRFSLGDEVSRDKDEWQTIRECPELIPEVLKSNSNDVQARERIEAARRWADERRSERREGEDPDRLGPGRRGPEAFGDLEYRQHREQTGKLLRRRRERTLLGVLIVMVLLGTGIVAAYLFPTPQSQTPQCNVEAAPGVNWQQCQMVGAQLLKRNLNKAQLSNANLESASLFGSELNQSDCAYINLKNANLSFVRATNSRFTGADMQQADLSDADFSQSDLSYVNFKNAKVANTNFSGAKLDHSIWIDGRICLTGSTGKCRFTP